MIALYMRLSRADGDLEGVGAVSNSIANQRAMLRSFVERDPGLTTTSCTPHRSSSSKNAPRNRALAVGSALIAHPHHSYVAGRS